MRFRRGDYEEPVENSIYPAYAEWEHAAERLQGETDIFDCKDALMALNRAVLHRGKALNVRYQFRSIPGIDRTLKNT